jgi:methyl-accepting chemotaxis protein
MHPRHLGAPLFVLCLALACSVVAKQARDYTGELFAGIGVITAGLLFAGSLRASQSDEAAERRKTELAAAASSLDELAPRLADGAERLVRVSEECGGHARTVAAAFAALGPSIEALAGRAADSGKALGHLDVSNEAALQAIAELSQSAREATASIGELAASIRDVARNVDGLARTADETSASMNAMFLSIAEVQSNANETARLSEEVAADADRGAEAILKTIGEIVRIKESSLEAVSVIASLGSRIDAVGQILAVIDDVAEQTNLLALNAAIIAAQAGEHGKGFAVVADEIKDLAERAGGSTKEISELVKTIQAESKNAISAVERGAHNVERGVEVSADAERALKKILESSQKSTQMVRAIANATADQARGSKQVTDAMGRMAESAKQIATSIAAEARGSDAVVRSVERMRSATQHVERSSQEQTRGVRAATDTLADLAAMAQALEASRRTELRGGDRLVESSKRAEEIARTTEDGARKLTSAAERVRRASGG